MTDTANSVDPPRRAFGLPVAVLSDPGALLTRGIAGGLFGGFAFLLANMLYATYHGKPSVAPLLSISTIFNHTAKPMVMPISPADVFAGLVLHTALSMTFGVVFALLVVPLVRNWSLLLGAGLIYGVVLWAVDIEAFGRTVFPWFTNPHGPNQLFELPRPRGTAGQHRPAPMIGIQRAQDRARSREEPMTITTMPRPSDMRRIGGSVILLLAGVLFGVISVYSDTRAGCAFWVTLALIATFTSGLLAAHVRTRR